MVTALLGLLIWCIVFAVVIYVIYFILGLLAIGDPIRKIVMLIVGAIGLIILLEKLIPMLSRLG